MLYCVPVIPIGAHAASTISSIARAARRTLKIASRAAFCLAVAIGLKKIYVNTIVGVANFVPQLIQW
jgi:hypothetical protein